MICFDTCFCDISRPDIEVKFSGTFKYQAEDSVSDFS